MYLPLLLSALAFVISFFSFFYFRSFLKRRTSQQRILAELQEEVNTILKSINEITERDISLIESREVELKNLLAEIEKRLKLYIREMEKFGNVRAASPAAAISDSAITAAKTEKPDAESYSELGKKRYRIGKQENSKPEMPPETSENNLAFRLPDFDLKEEKNSSPEPSTGEQVRSLLQSGFSAQVVAARLGVSIAEVELAAALLERQKNPNLPGS